MFLNKTFIVTGASSGIGKEISRMLLAKNANVIGVGRHVVSLDDENRFEPIKIDFEKPQLYEEPLKNLVKKTKTINGCICAAGIGRFGALEQFSFAQMQSIMHVNFTAHALLLRYVLPKMKQQKSGDVIFIGSESALTGGKNGAMYCASKFALRGLALSLREECAKSSLRIALINPGMVKTAFFDTLSFTPGEDRSNYLLPVDVANTVALILASRQGTVFDEINLSPQKQVIDFRSNQQE